MSEFTQLPRNIADCMKRAGAELSEDQKMLLVGYLAPVQQVIEQLQTKLAESEARVVTVQRENGDLKETVVQMSNALLFVHGNLNWEEESVIRQKCRDALKGFDTDIANKYYKHIEAAAVEKLQFPTILRKMWSGGEVQEWLKEQANQLRQLQTGRDGDE